MQPTDEVGSDEVTHKFILCETVSPNLTADFESHQKWGTSVLEIGLCLIPSLLLREQQRLDLKSTELLILLQLCDFWTDHNHYPSPSKNELCQRMGLGERQLQRHLSDLEQAVFIARIERYAVNGGKLPNEYDLSGLVAKLKAIEPDCRKTEDSALEKELIVKTPDSYICWIRA